MGGGNRLTKTDSVTGNDTLTYNAANMLLTRNGAAYTNDANGNMLTGGGRVNTWDGQNRLVQCVFNGTTTTHAYGSDGLRRRTTQGATSTDYVLDGQSVVRTLVNGVVDKTYLHGARGPEYERVGSSAPVWYLYDGRVPSGRSVLGTVDAAGNLVSTRKYDVYGAVRGSTGPSGTKHKWVGQLWHPSEGETGLVYMRARYYDPTTGRFISQDPARAGKHWWAYASNSPTNLVDPTGKSDKKPSDGIQDMFDILAKIAGLNPLKWLMEKAAEKIGELAEKALGEKSLDEEEDADADTMRVILLAAVCIVGFALTAQRAAGWGVGANRLNYQARGFVMAWSDPGNHLKELGTDADVKSLRRMAPDRLLICPLQV